MRLIAPATSAPLLLGLLIALGGCDGGEGLPDAGAPDLSVVPACNATDPRTVPVVVQATPEAGEQPYVDALAAAQKTIRVEIYEMGQGGILDQLIARDRAGVVVQVILDQAQMGVNQKYFDMLKNAGVQVKWSSTKFTYQHAKFFVVDGTTAVVSTGNYSAKYSILVERNFVATDRDPADVAALEALFLADWNGTAPDLACTRLVISPVNARQRILDLIASARKTLTIESMQFADTDVRVAVQGRVQAGVAVRAMIADASFVSANTEAAAFLKQIGVEVRTIPHLHTKALVVDGAAAYMGSENLSYTSLNKNREAGLVLTDDSSIAPLRDTFEKDWAAGTAF